MVSLSVHCPIFLADVLAQGAEYTSGFYSSSSIHERLIPVQPLMGPVHDHLAEDHH